MQNLNCVAGIGSVTYAMKAQEILTNANIQSNVIRLRPEETKRGCAYGIRIDCAEFKRAIILLRNSGIQVTPLKA